MTTIADTFIPSRDGLCDCRDQCETCGDCAYTEQQGDAVAIGRFCGPNSCLDADAAAGYELLEHVGSDSPDAFAAWLASQTSA